MGMTNSDACDGEAATVCDAAIGALVLQLIAGAGGTTATALSGRDPRATRGRQLAFYVVHVGLGWSLQRTGQLFGRQRSTISHACRQVEDRRDETTLDRQIAQLEAVLRQAVTLRIDL